ncbi:MAG: phosphomannomutase/phosphoglucomutase [Spirochaetales bacterium]|nr:phosphomannomutase/phosphoglucomutase [Spirochaetales bacterium]
MSVFKSYDVRGVYGTEWDRETALKIGFFLPALLETDRILVGRDARRSSPEVFEALSRGIVSAGCRVVDIGLSTTPAVYFATARFGFGGSVMITASHNPPEYNGLKISRAQAVPVGYGTGLERLESLIREPMAPAPRSGRIERLDIRREYLAHLAGFAGGIHGVKAVVDCSDGMASLFIHDVVRELDAEIITMYDSPDGSFPHHPPNPLIEANLADLKRRAREEKADLGICFDGDADRVMFVDEQGAFVSPDLVTGLLGLHFFRHSGRDHRGETVTYDVRTSRSVVEFLEQLGGRPAMCRVGHSHAKRLLRETNGVLGGELAGHYYFRDNYFCDSGMIAALLLLSVLSREQVPLSQLVGRVKRYHYSGELNFKTDAKDRIIERILAEYGARPQARVTDIDGIRIDYPEWWFNLRKSNTEPYLRLVAEARTASQLEARLTELIAALRTLDPQVEQEEQ